MTDLQHTIENENDLEKTRESLNPEVKQRKSMRRAINEKCRDCIYDDCAPGNWRQQVTGCTVVSCPLYEFRPVSKPKVRRDGVEVEAEDDGEE